MSLQSPLHQRHVDAGAKFAEFGGWSMPLEYAGGGVLAEHRAVRELVGVFDVSHLGNARISGPGAVDFCNRCLTADLNKIEAGQAQYTLLCNDDGGVIDDMIAYRISDDEVFLIPNAANCAAVVEALSAQAPAEITVTNEHHDYAIIAIQGPRSADILTQLGLPTDHDYMSFVTSDVVGVEVIVCRTGYTGEHGYELVVPIGDGKELDAVQVWDAVLAAAEGVRPCGLGARDTLRTEMGYPLHGQDISPTITPVEARLGWAVGWKKETFAGAEALRRLKADGAERTLRGLKAVGRGIPRQHMVVRARSEAGEPGAEVGEITSGTFSPTLKTGIALALIDSGLGEGDQVLVDIRNRQEAFEIVKPPFVTPGVRESK